MKRPQYTIPFSESVYEKAKEAAKIKGMLLTKYIRTTIQEELKILGFRTQE